MCQSIEHSTYQDRDIHQRKSIILNASNMETIATLRRQRWVLPVLGLLLFLLGVFEYPRALAKMRRTVEAWYVVKNTLAMIIAIGAAAWIGWRAQWLDRLERIQSGYWIATAIVLAIVPSMIWRKLGYSLSIPLIHVNPGYVSLLALFGWIAHLRADAVRKNLPHDWDRSSVVALLGIAAWAWTITAFNHNLLPPLTGLVIAMIMLRGTKWFRASIIVFGAWSLFMLAYFGTEVIERDQLIGWLAPFQDLNGYNFVPYQARKTLSESGWFGGASIHPLTAASHQFMLSTVGEHFGWLGLLFVVFIVTMFLLLARILLRKLPDSWLRYFATAILAFLIVISTINLIANLGLTSPAGLGIPFLSRSWFLAAVASFLIGISLRDHSVAVSPAPTIHFATPPPVVFYRRLAAHAFAAPIIALLGLTLTHHIALSEKPVPQQARGDILDRNGSILATNERRIAVWLDRSTMTFTDGRKLATLGRLIEKSPEAIYQRAMQSTLRSPVYLAYNLPLSLRRELEELRFPGLNIHEMNTRVYPHGEAAAHVLGFTTADTNAQGLIGVELARNPALTSRHSKYPIKPITLYLDSAIQQAAYTSLKEISNEHNASLSAAMVVNMNGEVLAMANTPGFDPADRKLLSSWITTNHALTNEFPLGDLLHPITRAAVLSEGTGVASDWWLRGKLVGLGFGQKQWIDIRPNDASWGSLCEELVTRPHLNVKATLAQLTHAYLTLTGDGTPRTLFLVDNGFNGRWNTSVFHADTVQATRRELEAMASKYVDIPGIRTGGAAASIISPSESKSSDSRCANTRLLTPRAIDVYIGLAPIDAPKYVVAVMLQRNGARRMSGHPAAKAFVRIMQAAMDYEKKRAP